jgi:4-carboxymuconolactone decarboxylase
MNPAPSMTSVLSFPEAGLPERLGPPATLDAAQQEAADELINGPRGESLRYEGTLDAALREWTICVVARELSNVFEWDMHVALASAAGVPSAALAALDAGQPLPHDLRADLGLARIVAHELISQHRLSDGTYAEALKQWGEPTVVELLALVGYFAMVCWLMNVARTPGPAT